MPSQTVMPNNAVTVTSSLPTPPDGFGFTGWLDQAGNLYTEGKTFVYSDLRLVTEPGTGENNNTIKLTAQYERIPQGSLIFDTRGGTKIEPIYKTAPAGSGSYQILEEEVKTKLRSTPTGQCSGLKRYLIRKTVMRRHLSCSVMGRRSQHRLPFRQRSIMILQAGAQRLRTI